MTEKVKVEFEVQMGDEGVRVTVAVPAAPVPARRMLPLFQGLTNQFVDVAVGAAARRGDAVTCKPACGACCRQLVPISWTEARQIRALVDAMPEPRRSVVRARFADALSRAESGGLLREMRVFDALPDEQFVTVHPRYFALRIACPFLEDEDCSIYPHRPLVCREHLVTSPPELCSEAATPDVRRIPLPAFPSLAVCKLEGNGTKDSRLALLLALEWTEEHSADEEPQRPALEWIDVVLEGITEQQARKAP